MRIQLLLQYVQKYILKTSTFVCIRKSNFSIIIEFSKITNMHFILGQAKLEFQIIFNNFGNHM